MKLEPDIVAMVELAPTEKGGREGPTPDRKFGCIMVVNGQNHDVRLRLDRPFQPGSSRRVGVDFLCPDLALSHIRVGDAFVLREMRTIGTGVVELISAHALT